MASDVFATKSDLRELEMRIYFSAMSFFTSLTPWVFLAISPARSFYSSLFTNPLSWTVPCMVVTFTSVYLYAGSALKAF